MNKAITAAALSATLLIGGATIATGLHKDVRALSDRIAELEAKLQAMADSEGRE